MAQLVKLGSYAEARAHFNRNVTRSQRRRFVALGAGTTLHRHDDGTGHAYAIHLDGNQIITYHYNGVTELRTGGHMTPTVKRRLNMVDGCHVFQDQGEWYVEAYGQGWRRKIHWLDADSAKSVIRLTSRSITELTEEG